MSIISSCFGVSIRWHLGLPVCRTKSGLRRHLYILPLAELMWLCSQFEGASIEETVNYMWVLISIRRNKNGQKAVKKEKTEKSENNLFV